MSNPTSAFNAEFFSRNILSSLVVFLVAIPLCLGIAIGSGADPATGLISGIIGGIVIGSLAGAPLQVSGPAAGLVVLTFDVLEQHKMHGLMVVLVIAGSLQILTGILKCGTWFRAVTPAVVQGMLAGIGLLIFIGQLHVMFAYKPNKEGLHNLRDLPHVFQSTLQDTAPLLHWHSALTGLATIAVMIAWKRFIPKKFALIPPALVGVVVGAILIAVTGWEVRTVVVGNLWEKMTFFSTTVNVPLFGDPAIWVAGLGMGFVASAESLLCATAITRIQPVTIKTNYNREIIAQGVGNTVSGLVGGLPITGVIVRSAANVSAGATSRLSAILHGFWILGFVVLAPGVLNLIPIPSLAAILVLTGLKLMDLAAIRSLSKYGRENVLIYFVTLLTIFCTDLLMGVVAGIVLSAIMVLYRLSNLHIQTHTTDGITRMDMHGGATFLSLPRLAKELEVIPPGSELHVNLSHLDFIDHACLELLMNWQKQHESGGGKLYIDWGRLTAQLKRNRSGKLAEPMDEATLFAAPCGH